MLSASAVMWRGFLGLKSFGVSFYASVHGSNCCACRQWFARTIFHPKHRQSEFNFPPPKFALKPARRAASAWPRAAAPNCFRYALVSVIKTQVVVLETIASLLLRIVIFMHKIVIFL